MSGASADKMMILMVMIMMLTSGSEIEVLSPKIRICEVRQKTSKENET